VNASSCCKCASGGAQRQATAAKRCLGVLSWLAPTAMLVIVPKCPICFAAYVALFTGIGVSLPVAHVARTALIVACLASLAFLSVRLLFRVLARQFHVSECSAQ